jgi:DNA-binding CsgD family transcriptional regulator
MRAASSRCSTASDRKSGWVSGRLSVRKGAFRTFASVPTTNVGLLPVSPVSALSAPAELPVRDAAAELHRRDQTLRRTRASMDRMRARTTVAEMLAGVPDEVRSACGLSRAAVFTRRGSELVPAAGDVPRPGLGVPAPGRIVIDPGSAEGELLRRGTPMLARAADVPPDRRLLVHRRGYVAAAVAVEGRTLAVLVAAGGPHHCPDLVDRDGLHEFAERLGWMLEHLLLRQRTAQQTAQLGAALGAAQRLVDTFGGAAPRGLLAADAAIPRDGRIVRPVSGHVAWELTARERTVLEQMAGGKTNRSIAAELFLSEGTVKCHVKRILRKLDAANRAEAVARFLGAADGSSGDLDLDAPPAAADLRAGSPLPALAPLRLLADGSPVGGRR